MSYSDALVTLNKKKPLFEVNRFQRYLCHEDSRMENYTFDFQKHKQVPLFTESRDKYPA